MENALAFNGDVEWKRKTLAKLKELQAKGKYSLKDAEIGCLLKGHGHEACDELLGIPQNLARIESCIFNGLLSPEQELWPERFVLAIEVGADLSRVAWQFLRDVLDDIKIPISTVPLEQDKIENCLQAIKQVSQLMDKYAQGRNTTLGLQYSIEAAESARSAAESARSVSQTRSAAESARYAAESARSTEYALEYMLKASLTSEYTSEYVADSAESSHYAASYAVESLRYAARYAVESGRYVSVDRAYVFMSDMLIHLLNNVEKE